MEEVVVSAIISDCGQYRYTLHRKLPQVVSFNKLCLFIMLNPSTADANLDDPTIRRCIGFAKRESCTELTVVNLFALRATNPKEISAHHSPIGPDNHRHVEHQLERHGGGVIVAAWGAHPAVAGMSLPFKIRDFGALCLGTTKEGRPRHPLYVRADQPLIPWGSANV